MKFTEMEKEDLSKYMKWERPEFCSQIEAAYRKNPNLLADLLEDAKLSESENNNAKRMRENEKSDEFIDLLCLLEDYIESDFNGEKVETEEQKSRVLNTIDDLNAKFGDYKDVVSDKASDEAYERMCDVIRVLTDFALNGGEN